MTKEETALEMYKLEYERCSIRYEDIYKAIWTNFSYLSVISGAILTFGSTHLNANLAAFVACFPLLFWYWATFLPLDRYADNALERLRKIEGVVNLKYETTLNHYTSYLAEKTSSVKAAGMENEAATQGDVAVLRVRVRDVVKAVFFFIHILALILSSKLYGASVCALLALALFAVYICTHLGVKSGGAGFIAKSALLLAAGALTFYALARTPMPAPEKKTKKVVVSNQGGSINVRADDGDKEETIEIRLVGFEGVTLK